MAYNYPKCSTLLIASLDDRSQDIVARRFGLHGDGPQTLEAIGRAYGITRERVRQIVEGGVGQIRLSLQGKKKSTETDSIFGHFVKTLEKAGGLRREDLLVGELGSDNASHVLFFLHLGDPFVRRAEDTELHSLWTLAEEKHQELQDVLSVLARYFEKQQKPATLEEIALVHNPKTPEALLSYLEVSKRILQGSEGRWGLSTWPEINPKGMKDKAYIVLKNAETPLHFTEVARLIDELQRTLSAVSSRPALAQTVHNELIKDDRFVLVGRGTYGLKEWGYSPGTVKDVLLSILKSNRKPLSQEDIITKTLEQRQVKESTILMNLQSKQYFVRDSAGRYQLRR